MKVTKGKWTAKGLQVLCEGKTAPIGQAFLMNLSQDRTGKSIPDLEAEANAKMFAAAPELLKSLQEMVDEFDPIDTHSNDIIERAKDAIKEATS